MWDGDGNKVLDLASQLVFANLGHRHSTIVDAIQQLAAKLRTVAPQHSNEARSEAVRLITERLADDINHVVFIHATFAEPVSPGGLT